MATRLTWWILCGCAAAVAAGTACGQAFPTKPVRLVTAEVGGGADVIGRLLAQSLSASLGYQVVVENQGGANGIIAAQSVIKAPVDGHTVLGPSPLAPDLPTVAATLPGFEAQSTHGLLVRAGTPDAIVGRLNQEVARVLANSDFQAKLFALGVEPVGGTPAGFGEVIRADMEKWGKLIREGGVRAEGN